MGRREGVPYRLRSHLGLVELGRVRRGHRRRHARSVRVRRDERWASPIRLGAVRVAPRRGLRLERGGHGVPRLVVAVPKRRLGWIPTVGVVRVVGGLVGVEATTAPTMMEAAPVRTRHSLVPHITGAGHGDVRSLAVMERLILEGVRR